MAVPPAFADLGKAAKDIFNKGYGNMLLSLSSAENTRLNMLIVLYLHVCVSEC